MNQKLFDSPVLIYLDSVPQSLGLIQHGTDVSNELDLSHAVSVTKRWLDSCSKDHPTITLFSGGPSRVLDVSQSESGLTRLVTKDEVNALFRDCDTKYATLSHCWGEDTKSHMTTTENFSRRQHTFAINKLPQRVRDAMLFTHALGIKFLWIDALCIIQDDHDDWEREFSFMAGIYEHSYLNIAATSCSGVSGSDGLFNPRWVPAISAPGRRDTMEMQDAPRHRNRVESFEAGRFQVPCEYPQLNIDIKIMVRFSLSRAHKDITNGLDNLHINAIGDVVSPLLTRGVCFFYSFSSYAK